MVAHGIEHSLCNSLREVAMHGPVTFIDPSLGYG